MPDWLRVQAWFTVLLLLMVRPLPAEQPADRDVLKLNSDMLLLYDAALKHAEADLLREHPVILALFTSQGGQLMLYRPGHPPQVAPRVPVRYELLKSVSHSSMAIFAHCHASLGLPAEQWRGPLEAYRNTSQAALTALPQTDLPAHWRPNVEDNIRRNLQFMDRVLLANRYDAADLQAYARELKPILQQNIVWAAETQVSHWMSVVEDWQRLLGADWERTLGASNTLYVTRQNNILFSVLAQFFGKEALNSRLFLFETSEFTTGPQHMLALLARIVADRAVGHAFFNNYYVMDYELMGGDARRAIEKEARSRGLSPNLPGLVPFYSNEWPMRHDPSQGLGPATLDQIGH